MDWSSCSPDIIFLIFEKLDDKSLLICLSICRLWRNVAYHIIQTKDMWQSIAENNLYDRAICYKLKSTLAWQEICFNSLLWFNLWRMKVKRDKDWILKRDNIRALHMFKDKIIVIYDTIAEYFNVETSARILKKPTLSDCEETEHITITLIGKDLGISFKHNSTRYTPVCTLYNADLPRARKWKENMLWKLAYVRYHKIFVIYVKFANAHWGCMEGYMLLPEKVYPARQWKILRLADDRCFVIDSKNILWRYKCCGRGYGLRFIMRTYDGPRSIISINVHDRDVYILTQRGGILNVKEWGLRFNLVCNLEQLDVTRSSLIVMFMRHSIVYSVPREMFKDEKTVTRIGDTDEVLMECPGMTCATPHGELLLIGYEDGVVEICYPQRILSGTFSCLVLNIKDHVEEALENVAIVALEIYEAKGVPYLFVATKCHVFKLLLYY